MTEPAPPVTEPAPPARIVTLVLVGADGEILGQLPPFRAATPWWQDAQPVVGAARERYGIEVTILRLLDAELPAAPGGRVTYVAEVDPTVLARSGFAATVRPWPGTLAEDPFRRSYARPGGPAADLAWADGILAGLGIQRRGPAVQVRTWNLSSLWRLGTDQDAAWLKVVPPFFGHEGRVLEALAGKPVPRLLGHDGERMLLVEIPGADQYDAATPTLLEMVDSLVDLQQAWLGRVDELLALRLPEWRGAALARAIGSVIELAADGLSAADRASLIAFADALPERLAAIAACGLGDGLVHGDFHPGNVRGEVGSLVLLDWGDSGVGHPLLDEPAFLTRIDPVDVDGVRAHWHAAWRRALPGADPDRAARLIAPIAAARQAVVYQGFLDGIEASEQVYHRADVPDWLRRTAAIVRAEQVAGP